MKTFSLFLLFVLSVALVSAQPSFVRLVTNKGDITLRLYEETPKHRDLFLENIKKGLFDKAQFNRVIKSFVSQGGELDDTILNREKRHPEIPVQRIPAELIPSLFHKKGALGMGRNDNPEKSSYFSQIYLVEGTLQTDESLDAVIKKYGISFSPAQREVYKTIGGTPFLDQNYTLFGEIVEGMTVAEKINSSATNKDDVPLEPVTFTPVILSKKEAMKLWKKTQRDKSPKI
ncbi:peptidylprolyl isomerase [Pedobacter sp. AW31-3R]|uniref:peptidylprolyl isomerase n=1 Tax=Pedobacter sp. AW31-3R TaxID=3445781 RepID=UPI003F9F5E95